MAASEIDAAIFAFSSTLHVIRRSADRAGRAPASFRKVGFKPQLNQLKTGGPFGDDDSAFCLLFTLEALDHDAVVQRSKCHVVSFLFWAGGFAEQDVRRL
jgi:hypothetical protein